MGNLSYPPNIDAIDFLCQEIMPQLIEKKSTIKLLIAGISAPKKVKNYSSKNIDLIENFKDISESIAISKIMVAPMRLSIGLQNKIIQAMAMKKPCIVSTLSNNAIKAPEGSAIVEANSAKEFAVAILNLLNDQNKANDIAQNGYEFVINNYSWKIQNDLLNKLIEEKL
jgi:glycosyltransferase involved in cell wall biosynthesis